MDRVYCATCGRPLPPGARFCPRCGAPTAAPGGAAASRAGGPAGERVAVTPPEPPAGPVAPVGPPDRADTQPLALPLVVPPPAGLEVAPGAGPRSARGPLVAAGLLAALALAGGVWLLGSSGGPPPPVGSPSPSPGTSATASPSPSAATPGPTLPPQERAQLLALDALLVRTSSRRGPVSSAVTDLRACQVAGEQARQVFDQAAAGRRSVLGDLSGLDLSAVPQGETLRATLRTALQASADADSAFAAWAARQAGGCTPGAEDPDLTRGLQLSAAPAGPAKDQFVALWNPLAERAGLATRSADAL